jgi:predicted unusual protein kinase regulating ubiquinone biosynthesis (AarF/ABC1/UbiB family)
VSREKNSIRNVLKTLCMFWEKIVTYFFVCLTKHNVLFVKLFQALSSNNFVSPKVLEIFQSFTNSAQFYENEVDYELLDRIVDKYKIQLYSNKPINAGMISIVFKGRIDQVDVVVKMKRIDIYNRLQRGYREFGYFYKIVFWLLWLFGKHAVLNTIASFVESEDYILTQCEFKDELYAMRTMKKELEEYSEMGTIPYIDRIVVPSVYNVNGETEYIVMEFLDGVSSFDVKQEDEREYLHMLCLCLAFPLVSIIQHTDLHPGNLIFMNVNGVKKLGMIDFGMFVVNTPKIQCGLFHLSNLAIHKRDLSYNYVQHFSVMYEPEIEWQKMNESQYNKLNQLAKQMIDDIISGNLTETHVRNMFKKVQKVLGDVVIKINIDAVKILLGNTMVCATLFSLTNDLAVISEIQHQVVKDIMS